MRAKPGEAASFLEMALSYERDACLFWTFSKDSWGYGKVNINRRCRLVCRLICEKVYGPPPTDKHEAAHSCGNSSCVNLRHLRWATRKENEADKIQHGTVIRGTKSNLAKLSVNDVIEIRASIDVTQQELADRFGVTRSNISYIINRKSWPELV